MLFNTSISELVALVITAIHLCEISLPPFKCKLFHQGTSIII